MTPRVRWYVTIAALSIGVASCAPDLAPSSPTTKPSLNFVNRHLTGRMVSIFATYKPSAPVDRVSHTKGIPGIQWIGDTPGSRTLAIAAVDRASQQVIAALKAIPWIASVEVDSAHRVLEERAPISFRPTFKLFRRRSDETPWGVKYIGASAVHADPGNVGSGIKVAILDDGVACSSNSDLSSRVVGGYNFFGGSGSYCSIEGAHGTAVAGIIAASADGGGVIGVAPSVSIYSFQIDDDVPEIVPAYLAAAIDSAIAAGVNVINLSFSDCGSGERSDFMNAIDSAVSHGIVVVAAAGNGYATEDHACSDSDPVSEIAQASGVVAVTAFDTTYSHDPHGQYGSSVYLSAPEFVDSDSTGFGSYSIWHEFAGTSAATPHVAGAFALALAAGYTAAGAKALLATYAQPGPGQSGRDNYYGYGQLYVGELVPTTVADSMTWCTNANITSEDSLVDGNCQFTLYSHHGAAPVQAAFKVITSVLNDTTIYGWGAFTRSIPIPPTIGGDPADSAGYYMTVIGYARDSVLHRTDSTIVRFVVCNLGEEFMVSAPAQSHPSFNLDLPQGCAGGFEQRGRINHAVGFRVAPLQSPPAQALKPNRPSALRTSGALSGKGSVF